MKVLIVGSGYVGLVSGTCLAEVGMNVTCIDIDKEKIANLNKGISPIYEPGLDEMIERNVKRGKLTFSTSMASCLTGVDIIFSAVGTPPHEDGSADLKYVLDVAKEVGQNMNQYIVMVTKSTVTVGTAKKVRNTIQKELDRRGAKIEFDIASNPEFLKEGDAINDFMKPDRIVVGVETEKAQRIIQKLYEPFISDDCPLIFMDVPSAEMTKYAANSMLATRISFMNDIANLCEIVGADINKLKEGIGSDTRIGTKFLNAGIGYGGSCFPKDVKALIKTAEDNGYELKVLKAVEDINSDQKLVLFNKINNYFGGDLKGKTIAMWGLSFKPETDDMREAPSLVLIDKFLKEGCKIKAYDREAMKECERIIGDVIEYGNDQYEILKGADCLVLITEWKYFVNPDFNRIKEDLNIPVVFDGRNLYNAEEMKNLGFDYFCIGIDTK